MENIFSLVLPVAGMSSRFNGKIKHFAKVGPNGETLIEYSLNQAISAGFNNIIFIIGDKTEIPFKEKFKNSFRGIPVSYVKQSFDKEIRDKPWGTIDALCVAKDVIKFPFVFCNGDDIYGKEAFEILINHLKEKPEEPATLGYVLESTIPEKGSVTRGIFTLDENNYVLRIEENFNIEKNKLSERGLDKKSKCSMNTFALSPRIVYELDNLLRKFKEEHKGDRVTECLIPTELSNLIKDGRIKMICYPTNAKWFGVTNPEDEEIVRNQLAELEDSNLD